MTKYEALLQMTKCLIWSEEGFERKLTPDVVASYMEKVSKLFTWLSDAEKEEVENKVMDEIIDRCWNYRMIQI